jgi:hypothetical protein
MPTWKEYVSFFKNFPTCDFDNYDYTGHEWNVSAKKSLIFQLWSLYFFSFTFLFSCSENKLYARDGRRASYCCTKVQWIFWFFYFSEKLKSKEGE